VRDDEDEVDEGSARATRPRRTLALVLVAGIGAWKLYDAIVAETVRATVAPSLYVLGLAAFAVSLLGPRRLQVVAFFAGAALCLAAMALDVH
jgi:hypothetical protein